MAKRKCEQPLMALLPPCKRPLCELSVYSRRCAPHTVQVPQKRKRKQEPEAIPAPESEKLPRKDGATAAPHPPSKKMKQSESHDTSTARDFQCQLEQDKLIQRSDIQTDLVTLYLEQMDHNPVNLSFMVEQDVVVKDLKPATAKLYDYYETDEHATVEYNHPCSDDKSGNSR